MLFKAIAIAFFLGVAYAEPIVTAVLNGASYSAAIAPGTWVAIYGYNLAGETQMASGALPTTLAGVSVSLAGVRTQLLYVSSTQINALLPSDVAIPADSVVPMVVTSSGGTSKPFNLRLSRNAPGIFTRTASGTGPALFFDAGFKDLDTVVGEEIAIFYATGLGPVDVLGKVIDSVEVYVGDRPAKVLSATLAPGFPGVYQINVTTPVPATDRLYVRVGGWQSNIAEVGIRSGSNGLNVSGDIVGLFPSTAPYFTLPPCSAEVTTGCGPGQILSVMLHAATYRADFDLAPSAAPFYLAAVTEGGSSLILIDRAAGTYTASVSTITAQAAAGNFSTSVVPLWNYGSCTSDAVCSALPGSIVPPGMLLLSWLQAVQQLPIPNTFAEGSPNAELQASGTLKGTHFVFDSVTNSSLSRFGGFVQVPFGPFPQLTSTMKLYVDGHVVASKEIPYSVAYRPVITTE